MKKILFFVCLIFSPLIAHAANDHLVINQIQTTGGAGATTNDFVEIYNPTSSPVDLDGYRLVKRTQTGATDTLIKSWTTSTIVPAGGYYLWANSSYATIAVMPDVTTSGTISDDNGLALRNGPNDTGIIVDSVGWGSATNVFVETAVAPNVGANQALVRTNGADTDNNAADFTTAPSAPHDLAMSPQVQVPAPTPNPTPSPAPTPTPTPSPSGSGTSTPVYSNSVEISEFLPNPAGDDSGKEWVELFNNSNSPVDLSGWVLDDESTDGSVGASAFTLPAGTAIAADGYLAIDIPAGNFALDNTGGDSVRLLWPSKQVATEVSYSTTAPQDETYARKADGSFAWTTIATKGTSNLFSLTETSTDDNSNDNADTTLTSATTDQVVKSLASNDTNAKIALSEIYPNPVGDDAGAEWIELASLESVPVSLRNWILDDGAKDSPIGSTAYKIQNYVIQPGELVAFQIPKSKFAMNNTGTETVRLFNPDQKLVDSVTYTGTKEGLSYSKVDDFWVWITPTPSDENMQAKVVDKTGKVAGATLVRTGNPDPEIPKQDKTLLYFAGFVIIWYIIGRLFKIGENQNE